MSDKQYSHGIELLKLAAVLQYTFFGFPCVYYGDEVGVEGYKDPFCRGCYPWGKENKLLLDFYRRLGQLRNNSVFADGDFRQLVAERGVYAFRRALPTTQTEVVVAVNCGTSEYKLSLNGRYTDMLNGRSYDNECNLQPMDYVVLQKDLF